ncbi:hypothetical protein [Sphingomonas sp. SRS2]|uniref:hypothetical protein n=1 Tax=Sphingomonas sp. SRS2 TaxID=133190 RepID=UPI0006184062|nr:hypothetical protein [Sphingomonas sp. SRS2]KKC24855.1 hypothetical protein WP12_16595 [Sphingomonas sp. SRS2]
MTAVRERIAAILDQRLQSIPGIAEYERDPSADPTNFPALSMTDNGDDPLEEESGITRYAMSLDIECYAEGYHGSEVSAELNEIHAAVVQALMQEPPIDGLAERFEEGPLKRYTAQLASKPRKGFKKAFTIIFTTRRGDPASQ